MTDAGTPARYYVPEGECPGCGRASHPGLTCDGATTEDVLERVMTRRDEPPEVDPR